MARLWFKGFIDVGFADYCIAYRILEPVFASTLRGIRTQAFALAKTVRKLNKRSKGAVTVHEIAKEIGWKDSLVYKHVKEAVRHKLLKYETRTRPRNLKKVLAGDAVREAFLPDPRWVLKKNPGIGKKVTYIDPFTGKWIVYRHERN